MGRVWLSLGYESWDAYTSTEFGATRLKLPREERQESVASLRESGLSIRAIASGLGISDQTVQRDLSAGVVNHYTSPAPVEVEGMTVNPSTGEVIEDTPVQETHTETHQTKTVIKPVERLAPVVGIDGKTYKRPEPKPVPTGDEANRLNAIQTSKTIGRSLEALQYLNYEKARTGIVTDWWPLGKHEVPPEQANYFTPAELRKLAQGLIETADLLEAHHVQ